MADHPVAPYHHQQQPVSLVETLQQELEAKNEEIFDLSLSIRTIEAETQYRIEKQENASQSTIRRLQEELRRAQQEANQARSQAKLLQSRIQSENTNNLASRGLGYQGQPVAPTSSIPPPPPPFQSITARAATHDTATSPRPISTSSATKTLPGHTIQHQETEAQSTSPNQSVSLARFLLQSLPVHTSSDPSNQTLLTLTNRFLVQEKDDTLSVLGYLMAQVIRHRNDTADMLTEDLHWVLSAFHYDPEGICESILKACAYTGRDASSRSRRRSCIQESNSVLLQSAENRLLKRSSAHLSNALTSKVALDFLQVVSHTMREWHQSSSLIAMNVALHLLRYGSLLTSHHSLSQQLWDFDSLADLWCHVASLTVRKRARKHRVSTRWESPDPPPTSLTSAGSGSNRTKGTLESTNDSSTGSNSDKKFVLLHALEWLTSVLALLTTAVHHADFSPTMSQSRKLLATLLDVLEHCIVPESTFYDHGFVLESLTYLQDVLLANPKQRLLLFTKMPTTGSTAETYERAASAIGVLLRLWHDMVILQQRQKQQQQSMEEKKSMMLDAIVTAMVRFFYRVYQWTERTRLRQTTTNGDVPRLSFFTALSESHVSFLSVVALLLKEGSATTEEVRKMLQLQLDELNGDEEELELQCET